MELKWDAIIAYISLQRLYTDLSLTRLHSTQLNYTLNRFDETL